MRCGMALWKIYTGRFSLSERVLERGWTQNRETAVWLREREIKLFHSALFLLPHKPSKSFERVLPQAKIISPIVRTSITSEQHTTSAVQTLSGIARCAISSKATSKTIVSVSRTTIVANSRLACGVPSDGEIFALAFFRLFLCDRPPR